MSLYLVVRRVAHPARYAVRNGLLVGEVARVVRPGRSKLEGMDSLPKADSWIVMSVSRQRRIERCGCFSIPCTVPPWARK